MTGNLEARVRKLEKRGNPPARVQLTMAIVNEEKGTITVEGETIPLDEYRRQCQTQDGPPVLTIGGKQWRVGMELIGIDPDRMVGGKPLA